MNRKPRVQIVPGLTRWTWLCRECQAHGSHLYGPNARTASLDMSFHGDGCARSDVEFDMILGRDGMQGKRKVPVA